MSYTRTFSVPVDVVICPACNEPMHIEGGKLELDGDPMLHEISYAVSLEIARRQEEAIIEHYTAQHRLRWWIFRHVPWKRVLW